MTVYKIGCDKIKITLTHSEVLSYFGDYEKIACPTADTKLAMKLLLKESMAETGFEADGRLLVEVKARERTGCIIEITAAGMRTAGSRNIKYRGLMLEFSDSESMLSGVTCLYRHFRRLKSSLYKMPKTYRLIVNSRTDRDFFFMNEFCLHQSDSPFETAYTEEHGRLLIKDTAVEKIGSAFSKSF